MKSQAQTPDALAVTDYEDKPLRPLNELRHVDAREFRSDIDFMVEVLCSDGNRLNQADYLFRLILLIKESLTDALLCKHGDGNEWPGAAENEALFLTFIHTDYGSRCFDTFVKSLMGERPVDEATDEAEHDDETTAELFDALGRMYQTGAKALRRGGEAAISDLMQRSENLIGKMDAARAERNATPQAEGRIELYEALSRVCLDAVEATKRGDADAYDSWKNALLDILVKFPIIVVKDEAPAGQAESPS